MPSLHLHLFQNQDKKQVDDANIALRVSTPAKPIVLPPSKVCHYHYYYYCILMFIRNPRNAYSASALRFFLLLHFPVQVSQQQSAYDFLRSFGHVDFCVWPVCVCVCVCVCMCVCVCVLALGVGDENARWRGPSFVT